MKTKSKLVSPVLTKSPGAFHALYAGYMRRGIALVPGVLAHNEQNHKCNLYVTACILLKNRQNLASFICFENAYLAWQLKTFGVSPAYVLHGMHPGNRREDIQR